MFQLLEQKKQLRLQKNEYSNSWTVVCEPACESKILDSKKILAKQSVEGHIHAWVKQIQIRILSYI